MYLHIFLCVLVHSVIAWKEHRIIGGHDVSIDDHPYQAALYRYTDLYKGYACGAIILNSKHLLTTVYCALDKPNSYSVVVGETIIPSHYDVDWLKKKAYQVENIIIHPKFDIHELNGNDVAIMTVAKDLILDGKSARAIQLSRQPTPKDTMAVISGFGLTSKEMHEPTVPFFHLKETHVPVIDHDICVKIHNGSRIPVTEDLICAGMHNNKGSCYLDNGGPLVSNNKLIGVASHNTNCGKYGIGVYSDVYKHSDFINRAMDGTLQPEIEI